MRSNTVKRFAQWMVFAVALATPCFAHHMAVVVSKDASVETMTSAQLSKVFRAETKKWPDGRPVVLVFHHASPGEMITLQHLNKMTAAQFQAWTVEHRDSLKFVDSDSGVLDVVESTPGAVGLVEVHSLTDGVKVIRVDGKMPMEDGYLPH
jgi:ABC-type phosphate transport system substrate-binding protein